MRAIHRMLLVSLLLPGSIVQAGWARAAPEAAARGGKSVKECNEELGRETAALEAAGESASAFFHACWFHSEKGQPTPIVAKGQGTVPPDGQPAPKPSVAGSATTTDEAEGRGVGRRAVRHAARGLRRARRVAMRRYRQEGTGIDEAAMALSDATPVAVRPEANRPPGHVNVGVPLVGVVAVPILPGLEAAVRDVVERPLVPGLVTMSP